MKLNMFKVLHHNIIILQVTGINKDDFKLVFNGKKMVGINSKLKSKIESVIIHIKTPTPQEDEWQRLSDYGIERAVAPKLWMVPLQTV